MTDSARPWHADPQRWPRVRELVETALALSPELRRGFIDQSCGPDGALRDEVASHVEACERAESSASFLDKPAAQFAAPLLDDIDDVLSRLRSALGARYAIERELGRGGMAVVYLARDLRHDRRVALKVMNPALGVALSAERFLREIRVTAGLTHPHILPLHDSGEAEGLLYYVMPFVDGETLRDRLAREPMPLDSALRLTREVASALAYAHRRGIVHRDIKPANVLLADDHAVVADFGIARAVRRAREQGSAPNASSDTITDVGTSLGTPAYMAPEQAVGDSTVDHRADIYAFGVVAYEVFAGAHPFGSRAPSAIIAAHLTEVPPPIDALRPDLPDDLAAIVMKCLEKDPAARPQSADEIVAVLDGVRPTSASAVTIRRRPTAWSKPVLSTAAIIALLVVGGVLSLFLRGVRRSPSPPRDEATSAAAAMRTVGVIPFENTGGAGTDDHFSDGLTDELAHALASLPGLRVAGRTSSYAFKHKAASAQEIGRTLDVGAIVTGSVQRAGERLRVTAQLVSTADGKVVLDSMFESRSSDVFGVQDELTRAIVAALRSTLGGHPSATFAASNNRGTKDAEAYSLYLEARYYWLERGAANVQRSISYFKKAIARDSAFARAYAGLAMAYDVLSPYISDPTDSATALVESSAKRAMALDSTLADSHLAMALALDRGMRFDDATESYRKAIVREPALQYAHHAFGMMLVETGHTDEAIAELRRAIQLDPLAKSAGTSLGIAFVYARQFPQAIAETRRVLTIDSKFSLGLYVMAFAQIFGGQPDSAVATLERELQLYPERAGTYGFLVLAYAAAGRWTDAERIRAQLHRPEGDGSGGMESAFADLVFGDREPVIRLLATHSGKRHWMNLFAGFGCNPLVDPLWPDPRFRAMMHELRVEPCPLARAWPVRSR